MHTHPQPRHLGRAAVLMACMATFAACGGDDTADRSTPAATADATGDDFSPHQTATYEYLVPEGTGERLDDGDTIELMPQTLFVKVGESIYIENQDDRDYNVGPFFVAAGQSLAMRFNTATVLSGECLMNPSGEFQIVVEA
ncbi:MAG: hypothetical protein ABMA25_02615 [Ilumatobacteraceae bacterium]